MADYRDILKELGPSPEAATQYEIFGIPFNTQAYQDAVIKRRLYEAEATERLKQQTNPLRETTIGQISELSNMPVEDIASKEQYRTTQYSEPSAVPSYRFLPTLTYQPETEGPYDIRQEPDRGGVIQPITKHYPEQGPPVELPSLRGRFEPQAGPPVQYSRSEINRDAPANLFQQQLGMSSLEREKKWPRMYGAGAATLQAKIQARAQGYIAAGIDPDVALHSAQLELTGGTIAEREAALANIKQRTGSGRAREENLDVNSRIAPLRMAEQHRHNLAMEGLRSQSMDMTASWHARMQAAQDTKDWVAIARLNESRYWHDQMMGVFGSVDKAGINTDEEKEAIRQGLGIIQQLEQRDPTPDELSLLESIFGPRPRYKFQGRKPLEGPPTPQRGVAAPMSRPDQGQRPGPSQAGQSFTDAPPGKQVGDILKENGKPVAKWNGKTWQSMK